MEFFDNGAPGGIRRTAIIVLDWTTGEILLPYTITYDGAFLTMDLLILARGLVNQEPEVTFDIWSLAQRRLLWTFTIPILSRGVEIRFLKRPASNSGSNSPTRFAKLFVPDPRVGIFAIIFGTSLDTAQHTLVLSIHSFLRRCHDLLDGRSFEDKGKSLSPVLEWEEWSPDVARWLPSGLYCKRGSRTIDGARMLAYHVRIGIHGDDSTYNVLLDFNPRPIRRAGMDLERDEDHVLIRTVKHETMYDELDKDLKSSLAYRQWVSTEETPYWNLNFEANTILARMMNYYHFYSFLPQEDTEPPKSSLAGRI